MKRLSAKTVQSYDSSKLAKHLDKLMIKFDVAPFRVDLSYGVIYELSKFDSSYHHLCSINAYDKESIVDCIDLAWRAIEKGSNND